VTDGDKRASPAWITRIASTRASRGASFSGRACAQGLEDVFVEVEGREHENSRRRIQRFPLDPADRLDAVHPRHADVDENHVRA